jgi:hypothetical protein
MWHAWERREKCTRFWWEKPEEKRPLGKPRRRCEGGSEWILGRLAGRMWSGFDWLRLGTSDALLRTR